MKSKRLHEIPIGIIKHKLKESDPCLNLESAEISTDGIRQLAFDRFPDFDWCGLVADWKKQRSSNTAETAEGRCMPPAGSTVTGLGSVADKERLAFDGRQHNVENIRVPAARNDRARVSDYPGTHHLLNRESIGDIWRDPVYDTNEYRALASTRTSQASLMIPGPGLAVVPPVGGLERIRSEPANNHSTITKRRTSACLPHIDPTADLAFPLAERPVTAYGDELFGERSVARSRASAPFCGRTPHTRYGADDSVIVSENTARRWAADTPGHDDDLNHTPLLQQAAAVPRPQKYHPSGEPGDLTRGGFLDPTRQDGPLGLSSKRRFSCDTVSRYLSPVSQACRTLIRGVGERISTGGQGTIGGDSVGRASVGVLPGGHVADSRHAGYMMNDRVAVDQSIRGSKRCNPHDPVRYIETPQDRELRRRRSSVARNSIHELEETLKSPAKGSCWTIFWMVVILAIFAVFVWHPMSGRVDLISTRQQTLPPFCSSKRNAYDPIDCVQCPREAICFNTKAECPTYFALEKSMLNDWSCVNHKEELERLADEGLKRVVSYLRKVELAVPCGQSVSLPASRRDVIDLFEEQIVPLLNTRDRSQLGLREGLLQLYLRELVDEAKMKELYLEQQGSLQVTLASTKSSDRPICIIRRYSMPIMATALTASFFSAYFYLKSSGAKCTEAKS